MAFHVTSFTKSLLITSLDRVDFFSQLFPEIADLSTGFFPLTSWFKWFSDLLAGFSMVIKCSLGLWSLTDASRTVSRKALTQRLLFTWPYLEGWLLAAFSEFGFWNVPMLIRLLCVLTGLNCTKSACLDLQTMWFQVDACFSSENLW